jgi:membrane fusion protein (multidrug efflux system)
VKTGIGMRHRAVGFAVLLAHSAFFVVLPGLALARDAAPGVIVAEAQVLPFELEIEALGTARANESVEIRPLTSQRIVAIDFEEGERVERGHVLVELQSAEAEADVASARATLAESESQLRRARQLIQTRALSESELEQRLTRRDADRAALAAAEARLADMRIKAPFAGVVGLRAVSLGSYVTPDTIITTLDDTDTLKLDFDVPETLLSHLEPGLPVQARSAAWRGEVFEGRIIAVDTRIDPVSRSVTVRARLPNASGRLRPGMFLTVTVVREDVEALVVPEAAIVPDRSRQFVFVVDDDAVVERREVRTGRRKPGLVEIVAGLQAGEQVIVEGTQKAQAGRPVELIRIGADRAPGGAEPAPSAPSAATAASPEAPTP